MPASDYERAKDEIVLGRVSERIDSGDKVVLRHLREYSNGKRTRRATIAALGLENYSQLLKALRRAGIEGAALPKAQQEAMIRDLAKLVHG